MCTTTDERDALTGVRQELFAERQSELVIRFQRSVKRPPHQDQLVRKFNQMSNASPGMLRQRYIKDGDDIENLRYLWRFTARFHLRARTMTRSPALQNFVDATRNGLAPSRTRDAAPDTRYPDHRHPPQEIYAELSPGECKQNAGPWHAPGIGRAAHNTSNIIHGMRSRDLPLLAVWRLWMGEAE